MSETAVCMQLNNYWLKNGFVKYKMRMEDLELSKI